MKNQPQRSPRRPKSKPNRAALIAPSILAADFGAFRSEIESVAHHGADWIHVDVMDGAFVPPITFGAEVVSMAKKACKLPIDVHLMIREPERHIESFAEVGSSHITIHQEACSHLHRAVQAIHALRCKAGVAINPATPVQELTEVLELADIILIMTVNPGWGGQKFISSALRKISTIREECERRNVSPYITVDGGIDPTSAPLCREAGASVFVAGSAIFGRSDRAKAIERLRGSLSTSFSTRT